MVARGSAICEDAGTPGGGFHGVDERLEPLLLGRTRGLTAFPRANGSS